MEGIGALDNQAEDPEIVNYNELCEEMILPLFGTYCTDYKIAVKTINTYASWIGKKVLTEEQQFFLENFSDDTCPNLKTDWDYYIGGVPIIDHAVRNANYKFTNCVIKYNAHSIRNTHPQKEAMWLFLEFHNFAEALSHFIVAQHPRPGDMCWNYRVTVFWEIRKKFEQFVKCNNTTNAMKKLNNRGLGRMVLMVKLFTAISISMDTSQAEKGRSYVDCMKMYLRAIPDPLITKDDLREFIEFFSVPYLRKVSIEAIADKFETLFRPKANYEPRSLKHLCRMSVRENLRDKNEEMAFPALVEDLHYPKLLKSYLLCER